MVVHFCWLSYLTKHFCKIIVNFNYDWTWHDRHSLSCALLSSLPIPSASYVGWFLYFMIVEQKYFYTQKFCMCLNDLSIRQLVLNTAKKSWNSSYNVLSNFKARKTFLWNYLSNDKFRSLDIRFLKYRLLLDIKT